jgi:hypothetical protein
MLWQADYAEGWANSVDRLPALDRTFPEDPLGPDELISGSPKRWPHTRVVPFHYSHPVPENPWQDSGSAPTGRKESANV